MNFRFICVFLFGLILNFNLKGQPLIKIGIYNASNITSFQLKNNEELYTLIADNFVFEFSKDSYVRLSSLNNEIELVSGNATLGFFNNIIINIREKSGLKLKPIKPDYPENSYSGNLLIKANNNYLKIINEITLENYIVGVLRGEIGFDKPLNSYIVMSILARTYAEGNFYKHRKEGFNLCDQAHCQVFKGYFNYQPYQLAVEISKNKVIEDENGAIIEGLFHSNCGGITRNSNDVWKTELSYCKSVKDTFCMHQKNSTWVKTIAKNDLFLKLNIPLINDSIEYQMQCNNFYLENINRNNEMFIFNKKINTIFARAQLNLRSDWFKLKCVGDSIVIYGNGFGHGVGLCQEGCIQMAKEGCNEDEIIKFYFRNVTIRNRNNKIN
jgi:stage II sporulation protein D